MYKYVESGVEVLLLCVEYECRTPSAIHSMYYLGFIPCFTPRRNQIHTHQLKSRIGIALVFFCLLGLSTSGNNSPTRFAAPFTHALGFLGRVLVALSRNAARFADHLGEGSSSKVRCARKRSVFTVLLPLRKRRYLASALL